MEFDIEDDDIILHAAESCVEITAARNHASFMWPGVDHYIEVSREHDSIYVHMPTVGAIWSVHEVADDSGETTGFDFDRIAQGDLDD